MNSWADVILILIIFWWVPLLLGGLGLLVWYLNG
jgi:hypothetical protein